VVLSNKSSLGSRSNILKIANFNVLNLAIQVGKFERDSGGNLRPVADPNATSPNFKAEWALNEIRRQVNDESPDLLVLQEIESRPSLEIFRNTLLTKYEIIHVPGNDTRGIDVAVLVKQGLPFEVRAQSHRAHQHEYMGAPNLLYSRDLLTLSFHEYGRREALFVLAATHNKSQRSTSLDPGSIVKRQAQVEGALRLLEQPDQPRAKIYMGDLNADVRTAPEFMPLKQAGYREGMEILDVPTADRVTHHFFKSGNSPPESSQLDAIFFSPVWSEARAVRRSRVVPHRDRLGHLLDRPRTKDERKRQASDHNMYWVEVNLEALRRHLDAPAQPNSGPQPRPQAP
jgi:endonuclease/exonuclease/phosphatase family metal-dependent hydrolase